ncbi:hypothetical protein Ocin01_02020 [Orchesella cincta]|uniref:Uncharacterized protein n=1 Tax=Orchesella cincta TaxID=48709 RepID=A0A1D2NHU5_ORCCI|nr:hypothetical protein Ocin01_02020 [Orchesella cincta]
MPPTPSTISFSTQVVSIMEYPTSELGLELDTSLSKCFSRDNVTGALKASVTIISVFTVFVLADLACLTLAHLLRKYKSEQRHVKRLDFGGKSVHNAFD